MKVILNTSESVGLVHFQAHLVYLESVREGINLAIEEINAAGGVALGDTKELQLVDYLNDEGDGTKAAAAFDSLYSRGVDFILGGVTSGATLGLIGAADGTNILF